MTDTSPTAFDPTVLLSQELGLPAAGVAAVRLLIKEGATVPFIARYRKERTGNLDEVQIRNIVELVRYEILGSCLCPVAIAIDRIDLAIVREKTEGLRQAPLWQCIGRETLVKNAHRCLHARITEVRVKHGQCRRHDHAFVADRD